MNARDIVVRIVQPAEQPAPPAVKLQTASVPRPAGNKVLRIAGFWAIAFLGVFLSLALLNFGFNAREILIIIGIPLSVGLVTSYAIF